MTYHSEVVGSLLRPTYLADARKQHESGQLNAAEFKVIEDRAVNEAIALQETAGIDVVTDGEMRLPTAVPLQLSVFRGHPFYAKLRR